MRLRGKIGVAVLGLVLTGTLSGGGSAFAAGSGGGGKLTPLSIAAVGVNVTELPQLVAQKEGYFIKDGIDLTTVHMSGGPAEIAAIVSGSIDIGVSGVSSVAEAVAAGNKLAFFCGVNPSPPETFFALKTSSLKPGTWKTVFKEFSGKSLGVLVTAGSEQLLDESALKQAGANPTSVSFVPIGIGATAVAALLKGEVDAMSGSFPTATELLVSGEAKPLVTVGGSNPSPNAYKAYSYGYYADKTWLQSHEKLAAAFCRANTSAVKFMDKAKNLKAVEKVLETKTEFAASAAVAAAAAKSLVPTYSTVIPKASFNLALNAAEPPTTLTYSDLVVTP
jgi:NitT/TauT family transport system substrate-binding protein